jgi:hypothetical protein
MNAGLRQHAVRDPLNGTGHFEIGGTSTGKDLIARPLPIFSLGQAQRHKQKP